uniref:Uncharacterized protein n=1 Tax=Denticeps clupeoides TaxID=299321 RepID=A0AAY4A516_9TELE
IHSLYHISAQVNTENGDSSQRERNLDEMMWHLDSSASALAHGIWHGGTWWVNHGHEANKAELLGGEIDFFSVKLKTIRELVIRQIEVAET